MRLSPTGPEVDEDKLNLLNTISNSNVEVNALARIPKQDAQVKMEMQSSGILSAPLSGPIRPPSPDTLSDFSVQEYGQLRPTRSRSRDTGVFRAPTDLQSPPQRVWRARLDTFWIRNKGLAYMLTAQIFGTLMNVTTRLLEVEGNKGKGMHPFQIIFVRMGITFLLASSWMWYRKTPHFPFGLPEVRWLLIARGFGGFFGVFGMYFSLLYLPLADATVITFLAPGLACWACSILINEPFTRLEQTASFISLVGVILIARPVTLFAAFGGSASLPASGDNDVAPIVNNTSPSVGVPDASNYENVSPEQRLFAVGAALLGVFGASTAFITIRWISTRAHPLISVNYLAAWCTLVSIVMQLVLPGVGFVLPADLKEWGYLIFLGLCGFIMQFLLAAGLSYEKSSRATNITYTQMLFALSFDKLVFGHTPDLISIAGSTLILGSAMYVALQSGIVARSKGQVHERGRTDEESQQGLMSGVVNVRIGEDRECIPLEQLHVRALR